MSSRAVLFLPEGDLKNAAVSVLESLKVKVQPVSEFAQLTAALAKEETHLLILPEKIGEKSAEAVIPEALKLEPRPSILVGLQSHSMRRALELMSAGAWECVPPAFLETDLEWMIKKGIDRAQSAPVKFPAKIPFWKKRWFIASAAGFIFVAIGATIVKVRHDRKAQTRMETEARRSDRQFPLPYSHPSSISFQKNYFWIADWYAQSIYKHEQDLQGFVMLGVYHLSDMNPVAIAWQDEDLWVLSANHKIQKYSVDQTLKRMLSARSPANNPSGMAYDGKNLWTSDTGTRKIYRHAMDKSLAVEEEYDYPGVPLALFCEGPVLWSLDGAQNRLMRHKAAKGKLTVEKYVQVEQKELKRAGATWDGERFWTLSESPPLAIREAIQNE